METRLNFSNNMASKTTISSIKKDYLDGMEQINAGTLFPPNYIKIFCTLIMHPKGISQEEIQNITKIPLGPISEILQTLIDEKWAEKLPKTPGIRKRTYVAQYTFPQFFGSIFDKFAIAYKKLSAKLPHLIEKSNKLGDHPIVNRDHKFFDFMKWLTDTMIDLFNEALEQIKNPLKLIQTTEEKLPTPDHGYWDILKSYPAFTDVKSIKQSQSTEEVTILAKSKEIRDQFYAIINESADFMGVSPDIGNILLYFLLCGTNLTQNDLIAEFNMPRSRISRNIHRLENYHLLHSSKKPSSRVIYYQTNITLAQLIIGKMDGFVTYSILVKEMIRKRLTELDAFKLEPEYEQLHSFFLSNMEAYTLFERLGRYLQRQIYFRVKELEKHPFKFFQK